MQEAKYQFCTKCGSKIEVEAQFCGNCGNKAVPKAESILKNSGTFESKTQKKPPVAPTGAALNEKDPVKKMTDQIIAEFFSWEGRLNRLAYLKKILIVLGVMLILVLLESYAESTSGLSKLALLSEIGMVVCFIAGTLLGIRRCHDINKSGWFFLLTYIPVVGVLAGLYIWFTPGTKSANQYGEDPLREAL